MFFLFLGISLAVWYFFYYPEWAYDDTYHTYFSAFIYYTSFTVVCTVIVAFTLRSIMRELIMNDLTPMRPTVDVD